jgi:protein SCO1/2
VVFGYTNCPDVCGLVLADMASALLRTDPAVRSQVAVLFVTTDPARDTGPVMRTYLDRFDPTFRGLTGPVPRIKRLANALKVPLEGHHRLPSGGYEVGHGAQIIGVAPDHTASMVWTPRARVADLAADITALVTRQS